MTVPIVVARACDHAHTRTVFSTTEPSRVECIDCGLEIDSVAEQRRNGLAYRAKVMGSR